MQHRAWLFFALLAPLALACGSGGSVNVSAGGTGGAVEITGAGGAGGTGLHHDTTSVTTTTTASTTTGGTGPTCPPTPPPTGPTIDTPDDQWTWVPIAGSKCRGGGSTGIGVRKSPGSKALFIYLEGGGACFNGTTCAISASSFGKVEFDAWAATVGQTGIFNNGNTDNPVRTWNAVYVPYCSGDVHAGDASGADVPGGPQNQEFVGYNNVGLALSRLVPTFADVNQVLLTGISAGGFGAAINYDRVAAAFCPTPVVLLDDSGPPMSDTYLAPCLQKQWRSLWNLQATLPSDCSDCAEPNGGGIVNYVTYLAEKWPKSRLGLISSTQDAVISTFYGFGTNDCTSSTPLPGSVYAAGLEDLRSNYMASSGLWGTYFIDSTNHTWLLGPGYYTTSVKGKKLTTWIGDLIDGQPSNVGP